MYHSCYICEYNLKTFTGGKIFIISCIIEHKHVASLQTIIHIGILFFSVCLMWTEGIFSVYVQSVLCYHCVIHHMEIVVQNQTVHTVRLGLGTTLG